jgi:hypothetical protein
LYLAAQGIFATHFLFFVFVLMSRTTEVTTAICEGFFFRRQLIVYNKLDYNFISSKRKKSQNMNKAVFTQLRNKTQVKFYS